MTHQIHSNHLFTYLTPSFFFQIKYSRYSVQNCIFFVLHLFTYIFFRMAEVAPAPEATTPEVVATEPEVPEEEEIVPINVPILKLIKQQQMEHGLRHRDYNQYRRYCTNRARRLRRFLNFKLGEKRKVTPRKITPWEIKQNVQFIILMIINIEVKIFKNFRFFRF